MTSIDLNADLGEQVGHDDALLEIVTSANLAAGFHAGTPATMRHVCRVAVKRGVRVGAQVSYCDREGSVAASSTCTRTSFRVVRGVAGTSGDRDFASIPRRTSSNEPAAAKSPSVVGESHPVSVVRLSA